MTLVRSGFIPVPAGAEPGFDHADRYEDLSGASRMYVAHTGADRVDVFDCSANTYLRALPGHPGVAGVLIDSANDLLFTSDRSASRVCIYRCSDEELLARVKVGAHPNGLAIDPKQRVIATIPLPGRPSWAAHDRATDHVFVNIRDPAQIIGIGAASLTIDRAIDVPAAGPHGLWIHHDRMFCAADSCALVVLHRDTGKVLATLPLPGAPDVIMLDPDLSHLYVAIGEPGVICVFDTDRQEMLQTVPTEPGAHTLGIDQDRHAVYAFLPVSRGAAVYQDQ